MQSKYLSVPPRYAPGYHGGFATLQLEFSLTVGCEFYRSTEGTPGHISILHNSVTRHNSLSARSQMVQKLGHTPKSV